MSQETNSELRECYLSYLADLAKFIEKTEFLILHFEKLTEIQKRTVVSKEKLNEEMMRAREEMIKMQKEWQTEGLVY